MGESGPQPGAVLGDFIAVSRNEETEEAGKIGPHFHYNAQRAGVGPFWGHSRPFITVPRCITSGGIYGVSGISMDIPEISMFHKQVTLCHQSGDIL